MRVFIVRSDIAVVENSGCLIYCGMLMFYFNNLNTPDQDERTT